MGLGVESLVKGRVSAVTPVWNGEKHLSALLDSVLAQTYPDIEMILVDDGSTDGTVPAAEEYGEKFAVKGYGYKIVRAAHKNASAAINKGLPYVTGEYLIWPDSDDVLKPRSVEKRVRFLQSRPQYQCVRSLAYYFDGRTGGRLQADEKNGDLSKEELFWDVLDGRTFVCCGCYMLRTAPFFEIYPTRHIPEYDVGQNFQMLLPFLFRYKCPTVREQLYGVRVRPDSHSRRALTKEEEQKKYRDFEELVDEITDICRIGDEDALNAVSYWKAKRRLGLAVKYGDRRQTILALCQMKRLKKGDWKRFLKDALWFLTGNTGLWKRV